MAPFGACVAARWAGSARTGRQPLLWVSRGVLLPGSVEFEAAAETLAGRVAEWWREHDDVADAFVVQSALDYRRDGTVDGRLGLWQTVHVEEFLLDWLPRTLTILPGQPVPGGPGSLLALTRYLDAVGLTDPPRGGPEGTGASGEPGGRRVRCPDGGPYPLGAGEVLDGHRRRAGCGHHGPGGDDTVCRAGPAREGSPRPRCPRRDHDPADDGRPGAGGTGRTADAGRLAGGGRAARAGRRGPADRAAGGTGRVGRERGPCSDEDRSAAPCRCPGPRPRSGHRGSGRLVRSRTCPRAGHFSFYGS